jgi:hypothetical protein
MLNETNTNGKNGSRGAYGYGAAYAEAATSPHPDQLVAGDGPSRMFLDPDVAGPWTDRELVRLSDVFRNRALLQARGIITTPAGTPLASPFRIRLQGRLVVPRDLARRPGSVPIVFIVMGNHNAIDFTTPARPEILNFTGYDYIQQSLADLGIASCSVDTNFANALNLGIRARAEMILDTVALVQARAPAAILPKLDFQRTGLVGHSRGGDAVVMAALLGAARGLSFRTQCVASMAPTDFTASFTSPAAANRIAGRVPAPMSLGGALRYLVLLGAHDGDVSGPSDNGFGLYDRAACDKTLVFARGLTHNRFNTVWRECADYADGRHLFVDDDDCRVRVPGSTFDERIFASVVHREYAKFFVCALARRTLLGDATAEDTLRGLVAPSRTRLGQSPGLAGPAASIQWSVTSALTVGEFDAPGIGARTPSTTARANAGRPSVPHATQSFVASAVGNRVSIAVGGRDIGTRRELTFRLTSMMPIGSEAAIAAATAPNWQVRLVTSRGTSTCAPAQVDRRGLRDPNRPFFSQVYPPEGGDGDPTTRPAPVNVTKNQFDTIVIPLSAFRDANLRDVRAVEFEARGGQLPLIVDSFAFV